MYDRFDVLEGETVIGFDFKEIFLAGVRLGVGVGVGFIKIYSSFFRRYLFVLAI